MFDSGLGGLTVVRALIDLLPDEDFVYFGDTGRFPYGSKPPEVVRSHARQITGLLIERGVKLVVVACNSAAAASLETLRALHDLPIAGVLEPGLRAAAKATRTGSVGVIATEGTVASGAYQRAAARLARRLRLTCAACPGFVEFVEEGDVSSPAVRLLAKRLLDPIRRAQVDTLILGCTHYPLLARTIADVMGRQVVLVSSGEETAFEVRDALEAMGLRRRPRAVGARGGGGLTVGKRVFLTSGDPRTFRRLGCRFLGPEVEQVEQWQWT